MDDSPRLVVVMEMERVDPTCVGITEDFRIDRAFLSTFCVGTGWNVG